jgi:hypothetical protein
MIVLEVLVVLALLALALYVLLGRGAKEPEWRVLTRTKEDGTLVVAVGSKRGGERVVKELPPALEGAELTSELRLAREEAQLQAEELNRP